MQTNDRPALIKAIGRWALTAAVVNSVIGAGVFGLPSSLAGFAGQWSPVTVLIAGAGIFVIVLCFAEVGSRFEVPGGPYAYTREAFSPAFGFQVGWLHIWTRLFSAAAVLNVLSGYLAPLLPWTGTPAGRAAVMIFVMLLVTVTNVIGVRQAAWTVNVFTIAKLLPLFLLVALGIFNIHRSIIATQEVAEPKWGEAVLLLMFGYGGFESAVVASSETLNPKKDTAFALIVALLTITVLYFLIQVAVIGVLPNAAASKAPVAEALRELLGPVGLTLGSIAVIISVYGWLTGFSLMSPRIFYSMATNRELPHVFGAVHPTFRTPYVSILVNSAVALGLGLVSNFGQLATFGAISRLTYYAATCYAVIALRKKLGMPETFRAPAGPVLAIVGVGFCVWLLSTRQIDQAWFLPVIIAIGAIIWFVMKPRRGLTAT